MASFFPVIGSWFQDLSSYQYFEIIAVDEKYGTIEVQYDSGDISEFDTETWGHLEIVQSAEPDQGGSNFSCEEFASQENYMLSGNNPLDDIEPESFGGFDDAF